MSHETGSTEYRHAVLAWEMVGQRNRDLSEVNPLNESHSHGAATRSHEAATEQPLSTKRAAAEHIYIYIYRYRH